MQFVAHVICQLARCLASSRGDLDGDGDGDGDADEWPSSGDFEAVQAENVPEAGPSQEWMVVLWWVWSVAYIPDWLHTKLPLADIERGIVRRKVCAGGCLIHIPHGMGN